MIENITLGQIGVSLTLLVGIIGGIVYLKNKIKEWVEDFLDKKFIAIDKRFDDLEEHKFKAIDKRFDDLEEKIDKVDEETCKNFLVRFLGDVERDNADILPQEYQRFWEEYEHYIDNKGNSYIKEWVAKLKKKELL